jgi:hypothetical protein
LVDALIDLALQRRAPVAAGRHHDAAPSAIPGR